jgi:hypothetical protein
MVDADAAAATTVNREVEKILIAQTESGTRKKACAVRALRR